MFSPTINHLYYEVSRCNPVMEKPSLRSGEGFLLGVIFLENRMRSLIIEMRFKQIRTPSLYDLFRRG